MFKKLFSVALSATAAVSAVFAVAASADESTEEKSLVPVGAVSIEYRAGEETFVLEGGMVYEDGQYDMTWDVSDIDLGDSESVEFYVRSIRPNPLGIRDDVSLTIDEIWLDGEKLEKVSGAPHYAMVTDDIYWSDEIVHFDFNLKYFVLDDPDTTVNDELRIVFTMENLIDPETYREERPTSQPMPMPPLGEPVGTVSIECRDGEETVTLEGGMIYEDGQYDMTWDVADCAITDWSSTDFYIRNIYPNPLGIRDEVSLTIDEIWVDGEKLDQTFGSPLYAMMTDSIYSSDEIVHFWFDLGRYLDMPVNENIRVVFTVENLIDPSSYREEHPTQAPMPTPPVEETEPTTEPETTAESTTETTIRTTAPATTVKATTAVPGKNDSPKTGDKGVGAVIAIAVSGVFMAAVSRKKK